MIPLMTRFPWLKYLGATKSSVCEEVDLKSQIMVSFQNFGLILFILSTRRIRGNTVPNFIWIGIEIGNTFCTPTKWNWCSTELLLYSYTLFVLLQRYMEDSSFQGEFVLNFLGQVWQRLFIHTPFGKACFCSYQICWWKWRKLSAKWEVICHCSWIWLCIWRLVQNAQLPSQELAFSSYRLNSSSEKVPFSFNFFFLLMIFEDICRWPKLLESWVSQPIRIWV